MFRDFRKECRLYNDFNCIKILWDNFMEKGGGNGVDLCNCGNLF